MSRKLSSEEKNLVLDNQKLVYFQIRNLGVNSKSSDYDDLVSVGTLGLINAAITFNPAKEVKFSTYAVKFIKIAIFNYYRTIKKYSKDVSLYKYTGDDEKLTLEFTIEDPNSNFIEKLEDKEIFVKLMNIILNYLKGKSRIVVLYRIAGLLQQSIADIFNVSAAYIQKLLENSINKVSKVFNANLHYKEIFSVELAEDEYIISFYSKDNAFLDILEDMVFDKNLLDFEVNCVNDRVIIHLPACCEAFFVIAEIVKEIDNFSSNCDYYNNQLPELKGTGSKSKQIRDYILSLDFFCIKDLKLRFPDVSSSLITYVLNNAKEMGTIVPISKGKYCRNTNINSLQKNKICL